MDPRCLQYWRDGDVLEMVGSSPPGVLDSRALALQFGHRECGVHRCCTSVPYRFWPIAIARNATLDSMARRVQHAFRRCVTDPGFAACRRRLVREFEGLARGERGLV